MCVYVCVCVCVGITNQSNYIVGKILPKLSTFLMLERIFSNILHSHDDLNNTYTNKWKRITQLTFVIHLY